MTNNDNATAINQWFNASYILCIISLTTSAISMILVSLAIYYKRQLCERRSIRISGLLGFLICIASILGLVQHQYEFMSQRSSLQLRAISWLHKGVELSVSALSLLLTIDLGLLLLNNSPSKRTVKVQFVSELLAIAVALLTTHPILYICNNVKWSPEQYDILFDNRLLLHRWQIWPVSSGWNGLVIMINAIITMLILANVILFPKQLCLQLGEKGETSAWTDLEQASKQAKGKQANEIRWSTVRLLGYVQLPLVTLVWEIASAINHVSWLYGLQTVMASTQGILCLVLLLVHPAFDPVWHQNINRIKKPQAPEQLCLSFVEYDKSTIHLSPYHSRTNSMDI